MGPWKNITTVKLVNKGFSDFVQKILDWQEISALFFSCLIDFIQQPDFISKVSTAPERWLLVVLLALCHISLLNDQGIKMYDIFEDPQNGPVCQPCPACLSVTACCLLVFSNAAFTFRAVTVQRRHVRQELSMDRHFKITYWMNCTRSSLWLFRNIFFFPFMHQEA